MKQKDKICCFTGHRVIVDSLQLIKNKLKETITNMVEFDGFSEFYAGGAIGFDMLAANTVVELRQNNPNIKLTLILPCKDQDRYWNINQKIEYERIKLLADSVFYISETYTEGCMLQRNRYMVDNSQKCICYLKEMRGGTAYTVRYAAKKGVPIINLA